MALKNLFKRGRTPTVAQTPQTLRSSAHPFAVIDRYTPLSRPEFDLYDAIREGVPVVDAAISKIVSLTGGFSVKCKSPAAEKKLLRFLKTVPVGHSSYGIEAFFAQYFNQLLMYGTAVGEIVLTPDRQNLAALYTAPLKNLSIQKSKSGLGATVCVQNGSESVPVENQSLCLLTALNPKPDEFCGQSLLSSIPFMARVLLKIFHSVESNFDRVGNVRFSVIYRPPNDASERAFSKERAMQIANEWSRTMRKSSDGTVSDFVAVGDVEIKAIGSDNQILDCDVPIKHIMEQIVAKTGLPPFILGLSWSTTERMSKQQADILTTELQAYRRLMEPVLIKICKTFLVLNGFDANCEIRWENISLQDEVETAKADLYRAQTAKLLNDSGLKKDDISEEEQ